MEHILRTIELHKAESELDQLNLERSKLDPSTPPQRNANRGRLIRKLQKEIDRAEHYRGIACDLKEYI